MLKEHGVNFTMHPYKYEKAGTATRALNNVNVAI